MEKKKCYISLPITGRDIQEVKNNIEDLKDFVRTLGYDPVSPFDREVDLNATHEQHMREDLKLLRDYDYILMEDGWSHSVGCRAELNVALSCGIGIIVRKEPDILAV